MLDFGDALNFFLKAIGGSREQGAGLALAPGVEQLVTLSSHAHPAGVVFGGEVEKKANPDYIR